uniref:VASt domain-containing protein n=1 Tax=Soboliphyme baturini TaxID=241478 RepID=A0A183J7M3_9BILA
LQPLRADWHELWGEKSFDFSADSFLPVRLLLADCIFTATAVRWDVAARRSTLDQKAVVFEDSKDDGDVGHDRFRHGSPELLITASSTSARSHYSTAVGAAELSNVIVEGPTAAASVSATDDDDLDHTTTTSPGDRRAMHHCYKEMCRLLDEEAVIDLQDTDGRWQKLSIVDALNQLLKLFKGGFSQTAQTQYPAGAFSPLDVILNAVNLGEQEDLEYDGDIKLKLDCSSLKIVEFSSRISGSLAHMNEDMNISEIVTDSDYLIIRWFLYRTRLSNAAKRQFRCFARVKIDDSFWPCEISNCLVEGNERETVRSKDKRSSCTKYKFLLANGDQVSMSSEWSLYINPWKQCVDMVIGHHRVLETPPNPNVFQPAKKQLVNEEAIREMEQRMKKIFSKVKHYLAVRRI